MQVLGQPPHDQATHIVPMQIGLIDRQTWNKLRTPGLTYRAHTNRFNRPKTTEHGRSSRGKKKKNSKVGTGEGTRISAQERVLEAQDRGRYLKLSKGEGTPRSARGKVLEDQHGRRYIAVVFRDISNTERYFKLCKGEGI